MLSGMNAQSQVEENLRIAGDARAGALTAAEIHLIGRVAKKYREIMKAGCTGCGYCQPCPSGVDIPGAFELFNAYHTFGNQGAGFMYVLRLGGILTGEPGYASLCAHCLECLEKCPQDLPIPDLLELVAAQFEGAGLSDREVAARRMFGG
jgi:predicted aldo/keto reductase-like oxidoreductase